MTEKHNAVAIERDDAKRDLATATTNLEATTQ
jgi:hypothetical protein